MEKSDWELLTLLAENKSVEAQSEFFYRYRGFLLNVCRYRCKYFDEGDQLAEDVFQNTMIKALNGINNLHERISEETTDVSKYIKAWLATIARNEFREFLRKHPDEKNLSNQFRPKSDEIGIAIEIIDENEPIEIRPSIQKEKLDNGFSILSDREQHILMAYMEYYNPAEPNRHLPDDVIAQLCEQYDVNSTNLRKIKSRALIKLIKKIDESK